MDKIDTLIAYLYAIQAFAKDIHYSASGEAFYSKHLLADEVYKGIDEQIDALIETCILHQRKPFSIFHYRNKAQELATEVIEYPSAKDFGYLSRIIDLTIQHIESIDTENYLRGEMALIDSIAQDLQRKLGLITRQVG
jgi:DNA-binding ferritin-like protein